MPARQKLPAFENLPDSSCSQARLTRLTAGAKANAKSTSVIYFFSLDTFGGRNLRFTTDSQVDRSAVKSFTATRANKSFCESMVWRSRRRTMVGVGIFGVQRIGYLPSAIVTNALVRSISTKDKERGDKMTPSMINRQKVLPRMLVVVAALAWNGAHLRAVRRVRRA
jgi:hypothetical protein